MIYTLVTWLLFPLLWLRARLGGPSLPQNIVIIQTAKIGDFVCTTPLFREIKARYPDCRLTVIGHGMNEALARHNPRIDEFLPLPAGGLRGIRGRWWLVQALARRRIDTCITVSPSQAAFLAPLWAGVRRRLGVLPNYAGSSYRLLAPLLTATESHQAGRLLLDTEWILLSRLGIHPDRTDKEAWSGAQARELVDDLLGSGGRRLLGLGVSSGNKLKEPGLERLQRLVEGLLAAGTETEIVLIGGPGDHALATALQAIVPGIRLIDTTGRLGLDALPALLARLTLYVGVDSGITYLAEATGVPVIDFMGPADADDQRPTGGQALVLRPQLPCAPCSHAFHAPYHCATGTRACIDADLGPALDHARRILAAPGGGNAEVPRQIFAGEAE